MVNSYIERGIIRTDTLKRAFLKVKREEFIPQEYRSRSYREVAIPLPALEATISRPRSYATFYQALDLGPGDKFLEIGTGSGYGAALAREATEPGGLVVSIEVDRSAHDFAQSNLKRLDYRDVILIPGDGRLGYEPEAPYDKIALTAAVPSIPETLLDQLEESGRLVAPVGRREEQTVKLVRGDGEEKIITKSASFVPMVGMYGRNEHPL